jgi:pimeloyl-ACP methyl ester carboxylesterase
MHISGAQLVRLSYGLLVGNPQQFPALIYTLKQNDYGALTQIIDHEAAPSDATAWVMSWSIVCSDGNYGTHELVQARSRDVWPQLRGLVAGVQSIVTLCDSWPVRKATAASFQAVKSAIPTLVLEGSLDAITPPAYGRLAAQTLTHSFYVEFPDRGHSVRRGDSCSYQIITAFLAQPTIAPDSHCTAALAVDFTGSTSNGNTNAQGRGGNFTLQAECTRPPRLCST